MKTIKVTSETHRQIKIASARCGLSMPQVVGEAIKLFINDVAKRNTKNKTSCSRVLTEKEL